MKCTEEKKFKYMVSIQFLIDQNVFAKIVVFSYIYTAVTLIYIILIDFGHLILQNCARQVSILSGAIC